MLYVLQLPLTEEFFWITLLFVIPLLATVLLNVSTIVLLRNSS